MNVPIRTENALRGNNHRMRNNHRNGVPQRNNNSQGVEIPLDDIDFPRNDGNLELFMDNGFDNSQENELRHEMAQFQQYPRMDNANRNKANPRFAQRWQKAENNRMALERNNHHND